MAPSHYTMNSSMHTPMINLQTDGPRSIRTTIHQSSYSGSTIVDVHGRKVSILPVIANRVIVEGGSRWLIRVVNLTCLVNAPAGSLILWESRTIHYGAAPKEGANPRYATCKHVVWGFP